MIIESSNIQMSAEHQKFEFREESSSQQGFMMEFSAAQLQLSSSQLRVNAQNMTQLSSMGAAFQPFSQQSQQAFQPLTDLFRLMPTEIADRFQLATADSAPVEQSSEDAEISLNNSRARLFQALFEALTGRANRVEAVEPEVDPVTPSEYSDADPIIGSVIGQQRMIEVDVTVTEYYQESECTSFSACGVVQTTDGESIDLNLNLEMSRSYESTLEYQRKEQVVFTDPLVINFNGTAAELTDEKYEFDLDVDGETEWISFLDENSGMLALDKNEDGIINDGSELFGAISGDGFADLAQYDEDNNGFIDEADSVFADLKIWSKHEGEDQLSSLLDRNVGAIYLGSTNTPFELKNEENETQGRIRQSGVYLDENGGSGTVQQIDMVV
ncbi:hypothetical protein [Motiliproteus sp. MSK22-1]|uniref:hypothetical protein n=1 Tax=Motiliproteus sp. MSK22-1 TaxID=1897630 RepID=UPI00097551E8|nr:hypothetical protein [Motiliproteus sp. MSK22-1]OMH33778.1 hypothetical protein BGP75_12355 [Motiliproteus sp. MSK22-1]